MFRNRYRSTHEFLLVAGVLVALFLFSVKK